MSAGEAALEKPLAHEYNSPAKAMQPACLTEGSHFDVEPKSLHKEVLPRKTLLSEMQNARMLGSLSLAGSDRGITRWVTLNYGGCADCCLFHLQKSWKLRFVIGATLSGMNVRLFTNHPIEAGMTRVYRELECTEKPSSPGLKFADVDVVTAGSFSYYFTVDESDREDKARGFGRFIVDPDLRVGRSLKKIPLDGITCQTVLSKNLGPFSSWMSRLMVAKKSGYNAIHFTPIQELGDSKSAYALRDMFKLNPLFGPNVGIDDVAQLVNRLDKDFEMLSFTDLVLNHAANESDWIASHPECVYNLVNAPHLRPAFILDRALVRFTKEIEAGLWAHAGIPANIQSDAHLEAVRKILEENVFPELRLWEFYQLNVDAAVAEVREWVEASGTLDVGAPLKDLSILFSSDSKCERFGGTVDLNLAARLYGRFGDPAFNDLRERLNSLNYQADRMTHGHLKAAASNIVAQARYRFVDPMGLRLGPVTSEEPLVNCYFHPPADYDGQSMADDEALMNSDQAKFCWVHSGWVDHAHFDPLRNFADRGSDVYIRRELNSWTDSVKLRYGSCRSDCPDLWDRARDYAKVTARIFHGIRLDNCHSTSLAVAEHVLNAARSVRPDLYVFAELFTGSGQQTIRHANRLGLNAVIQGALDLSQPRQLAEKIVLAGGLPLGAYVCRTVDPLVPGQLPVMFFDQTHDDPSPLDRRSAYDLLPTSALIAASASAIGSNRGYDEVIPRRISVISETRLYRAWDSSENATNASSSSSGGIEQSSSPTTKGKVEVQEFVNFDTGIVRAKKALNELHFSLATNGYEQVGVEVLSDDIIAMMRYSSTKRRACVVVAHSAFQQTGYQCRPIRPLEIPGVVSRIILEASVVCRSLQFRQHPELIVGLPNYAVHLQENIDKANSALVLVRQSTVTPGFHAVDFKNFKPGYVVAFDVTLSPESESAVISLDQLVTSFDRLIWNVPQQLTEVGAMKQASVERLKTIIAEPNLKESPTSATPRKFEGDFECSSGEVFNEFSSSETDGFNEVLKIVSYLSSDDSHFVLYEAADEKCSVYHIPGYGDLGHCGLAGLATVFDEIRQSGADPIRHPLGRNLCSGDWLMDYVSDRLVANPRTLALGEWFRKIFIVVKKLPRFLVPRYFEAVTTGVFSLASVQI